MKSAVSEYHFLKRLQYNTIHLYKFWSIPFQQTLAAHGHFSPDHLPRSLAQHRGLLSWWKTLRCSLLAGLPGLHLKLFNTQLSQFQEENRMLVLHSPLFFLSQICGKSLAAGHVSLPFLNCAMQFPNRIYKLYVPVYRSSCLKASAMHLCTR